MHHHVRHSLLMLALAASLAPALLAAQTTVSGIGYASRSARAQGAQRASRSRDRRPRRLDHHHRRSRR
ncbi:MAG: hypothetical protein IPG43_04910 [Proteobacteria bacterium]|nr:hypothetical protein [Pseudomonadota bacterium]